MTPAGWYCLFPNLLAVRPSQDVRNLFDFWLAYLCPVRSVFGVFPEQSLRWLALIAHHSLYLLSGKFPLSIHLAVMM